MRGCVLALTVLVLLVPTVQLMSVVSPSVAHHLSGKMFGKSSTNSRIPAVLASRPGLPSDPAARGVTTPERHTTHPGFSTAPFVPPRA